ncbi:MAG: tetratricopeptide repeat protein [Candidatus Obscuribacterales bacterium]|nr:tetratricopeptide repeat protein [Candidatus Obscuribacterales bacterium]
MRETATTDKSSDSDRSIDRIDSILVVDHAEFMAIEKQRRKTAHRKNRRASTTATYAPLANEKFERGLKALSEYLQQQLHHQKHLGIKFVALGFACIAVVTAYSSAPSSKTSSHTSASKGTTDEATQFAARAAAIASVQPTTALEIYQKALGLKPEAIEVRLQYASLLLRQNKAEEALAEAKLVLDSDLENSEAQRIAGICYERTGDTASAMPLLESVLEKGYGSRADVCYHLYLCALKSDHQNQAEMYIDEAVEDSPSSVRYRLDRAKLKVAMSKFNEAQKDLLICAELAPQNGELKFILGMCDASAQRFRTAIGNFGLAESLGFTDPSLYFERSKAFSHLERYHEALADINRYLESRPDDAKAIRRQSMYQRAMSYRTGLARSTTNQSRYGSVAEAISDGYNALNNGQTTKAIKILSAVVSANPSDPLARKYLAHALLRSQEFDDAVVQFKKWNELEAVPATDVLSFGTALLDREQYDLAAEVISIVVASQPNNHQARMILVKALDSGGRSGAAKDACRQGLSRTRNKQELDFYNSILNRGQEPQES